MIKAERKASNVHFFDKACKSTDSLLTLQCSDIHYDSLNCDKDLLKKHLDFVKERNGKVFIYGDFFDVMGCHKDPRSKPAQIDPRYIVRGRSYLDLVVEDAYEFLKPYAANIAFISYGNHETAILKHRDTDPLDRLVYLLNQNPDVTVHKGAYTGYVKFRFRYGKSGGSRYSANLQYHHGSSHGAKRSKGVLQNQIKGFMYPDADIIVSGHDHNKWHDPSNVRERFDDYGKVYTANQHVIKLGSYKKQDSSGNGWGRQKEFMPPRLGGWFVNFEYYKNDGIEIKVNEAQ